MNAAGTPVWHKQIVRAVDGQTRPNTQKRRGKGSLPSRRSEFVDGSAEAIYIAPFQHKKIALAVEGQIFRGKQARCNRGSYSVRSKFIDMGVARAHYVQ